MTFARAHGRPPGIVVAGVALSAGGLLLAGARASGGVERSVGLLAATMGFAGALVALVAWYVVASRGVPGRRLAQAGAASGIVAIVVALIGGAAQDGTLRLDRFGAAYFDAEIIGEGFPLLLRGMWNTLRLALAAEIISLTLGVALSSLALAGSRIARRTATVYVDVVRGLPIVVLTMLIYGGLPYLGVVPSGFAAAVAILGMNSGAYAAEIFRAGIQSVPRGQTEAARSLGFPHAQAMGSVVLPQAARNVIPPLVSDFIALLKDTAIVLSLIGLTLREADIFNRARGLAAATFSPTPYVLAAVFYLAMTIPLARVVGMLERRARARYA